MAKASDEGKSTAVPSQSVDDLVRAPALALTAEDQFALVRCIALREKIKSTRDLVVAYNNATDEMERSVLRGWLERYDLAFCQRSNRTTCGKAAVEYSQLAYLRPQCSADGEILKTLAKALSERIPHQALPDPELARALCRALQLADPATFDDAADLVDMSSNLTSCLLSTNPTTRVTYPKHKHVYEALHLTCVLLHKTAASEVDAASKAQLQRDLATIRERLQPSATFFPLQFHCELLEQAILRLAPEDEAERVSNVLSCIHDGTCGLLYLFRGVRSLATIDVDPKAVEEGFKRLRQAISRLNTFRRLWYDVIEALGFASSEAAKGPEKGELLIEGYNVAMDLQEKMRPGRERKALRYGIIRELRELTTKGLLAEARVLGANKLIALAAGPVSRGGWAEDSEVMEALFDALAAAHCVGDGPGARVQDLLFGMNDSSDVRIKQAVRGWKAKKGVVAKLNEYNGEGVSSSSNHLFRSTGEHYRLASEEDSVSFVERLKSWYFSSEITEVKPLLHGGRIKHVDTLECEVVRYKAVDVEEKHNEKTDLKKAHTDVQLENHVANRQTRRLRTAEKISLGDLFEPKSDGNDESPLEVRSVLLYGDPGVGKTCISKTIVHGWAAGTMMQCFAKVFFLPMRAIQTSKYDSGHARYVNDLSSAIANTCFPEVKDEDYSMIKAQVEHSLEEPSTLLVLDGLDERDAAGDRLLSAAKKKGCKLLMLSRPYNVEAERAFVDQEVECLGLTLEQSRAFIRQELSGENGERLIKLLDTRRALQSTAQVPVTANLLCATWDSLEKEHGTWGVRINVAHLYESFAYFAWNKFKERPGAKYVQRDVVLEIVGDLALDALLKEKILIDHKLLMKHAHEPLLLASLKDIGFLLVQIDGRTYQFPHLTFQEFFAGSRLALMLCSRDDEQRARARDIVSWKKYSKGFEVAMSFANAKLKDNQGAKGLMTMLGLVDREPHAFLGLQHFLTKVKVIDDFLEDDTGRCDEKLSRHREALWVAKLMKELLALLEVGSWMWEVVIDGLKGRARFLQAYPDLLTDYLTNERIHKWMVWDFNQLVQVTRHAEPISQLVVLWATRVGLTDKNWRVGEAASLAIGRLMEAKPKVAAEGWKALVKGATKGDKGLRRAVMSVIGELAKMKLEVPTEAWDALASGVTDGDRNVRQAAMTNILEIAKTTPEVSAEAWEALVKGATKGDKGVRQAAVQTVGEIAKMQPEVPAEALETLMKAAKDEDKNVRWTAVQAIRKLSNTKPEVFAKAWEALVKSVTDGDSNVRHASVQAIGDIAKIRPEVFAEAREALANGMTDRDYNVRTAAWRAIRGIAKIKPELFPKVWEALANGATDGDKCVRQAAMAEILEIAKKRLEVSIEAWEALVKGAADGDGDVRQAAMRAIGELAKTKQRAATETWQTLANGATDGNRGVRMAAVHAIGELAKTKPETIEVWEALAKAATDGDRGVRMAAVHAIGELAKTKPEAAAEARDALAKAATDGDGGVRMAAMYAIGELAKTKPKAAAEAREALAKAATDGDGGVRMAAMYAIGELAKTKPGAAAETWKVLAKCSTDGNRYVRMAAMYATRELAKTKPETAAEAREALAKGAADRNQGVRTAAIQAIGELAKTKPEVVAEVREALAKGAADENRGVRMAAMQAIGELAKTKPEAANETWETLAKGATDGDQGSRMAAMHAIGELVKTKHEVPPEAWEPLAKGATERDIEVRMAAIHTVRELAKAKPEATTETWQALAKVTTNGYRGARMAAMYAIGELAKAKPEVPLEVWQALAKGAMEVDRPMRSTAFKAIERMPIACFCSHSALLGNKHLAAVFLIKLMRCPLMIVTDEEFGFSQVVEADNQVTIDVRVSLMEFKDIISFALEFFKEEYPHLFNILIQVGSMYC